jgi:hypothetical protein
MLFKFLGRWLWVLLMLHGNGTADEHQVANGFGSRKASILAHCSPLEHNSDTSSKHSCKGLEELITHIPGLIEMSDKLSGLPYSTESEKLCNEICEQWKHMLNFCWLAQLCKVPTACYWEDDTPVEDPKLDFGPSFAFLSYWVANAMVQSWTARILYYEALGQAVRWRIKQRGLPCSDNSRGHRLEADKSK